jgi:hypothetical protein
MAQPVDAPEISDEDIYNTLKEYSDAGMIEYVLPTDPIGEQWIVGADGQILKFVSKEGIVGFLAGISTCARFVAKVRSDPLTSFMRGR